MTINPSLSGNVNEGFAPSGGAGVSAGPAAPAPPGIGGGGSSIQPSTQEAIEQAIESGIPYLMLPQMAVPNFGQLFLDSNAAGGVSGVSSGVWLMKAEADMQKIAIGVLDSWNKSLQEERERVAEWIKSPAYQAQLMITSPATQAKEEAKKAITPIDPAVFSKYLNTLPIEERSTAQNLYNHYEALGVQSANLTAFQSSLTDLSVSKVSVNTATDLNVLAAAVVISASGTYQGVMMPPGAISTDKVAINPVIDGASPVPPTPLVDPSIYNVINFFAVPLLAYSVAETMGAAAKNDKKPTPEEVAKNFASKVIALVTSSEAFNVILNQIITQRAADGQPVSPKEREQLATQVKITYLAMALALLYKSTLGEAAWITAKEFASILDGTMAPKKGSIEEKMKNFLMGTAGMPGLIGSLDQDVKVAFLEKLLAYMDTNPGVEAMLDPYSRVFDVLFAEKVSPPAGRA